MDKGPWSFGIALSDGGTGPWGSRCEPGCGLGAYTAEVWLTGFPKVAEAGADRERLGNR